MMLRSGLRGVKIRVWQKQTVPPMIWTALAFGDTADPSTPDWGAAPCGDERHSGANAGLHGHAEMARLDTPVHAPPPHTHHARACKHTHAQTCMCACSHIHAQLHAHTPPSAACYTALPSLGTNPFLCPWSQATISWGRSVRLGAGHCAGP